MFEKTGAIQHTALAQWMILHPFAWNTFLCLPTKTSQFDSKTAMKQPRQRTNLLLTAMKGFLWMEVYPGYVPKSLIARM